MTIYIGNIPYSMKEQNLIDVFQEFGPVDSAKVIIDKKTKRSKGYGFVEMGSGEQALSAVVALEGALFEGTCLRLYVTPYASIHS